MLFIILGILITIVVGTINFFDKKKDNLEKGKDNKFNLLTFLFLLIGCLITYWSGCNSANSKNIADKKADSVSNLLIEKQTDVDSITKLLVSEQRGIINLQRGQIDTAKKILSTSLNSNLLQKQINSLQSDLFNEVVGGDSKPVISGRGYREILINPRDTLYTIILSVWNFGKYPIHDVKFEINENYFNYKLDSPISKSVTNILTVIPSQHGENIYTTKIPKSIISILCDYRIDVSWNKGFYSAFLTFKDNLINNSIELSTPEMHIVGPRGDISPSKFFTDK